MHYKWPFSIAMLVHQRVNPAIYLYKISILYHPILGTAQMGSLASQLCLQVLAPLSGHARLVEPGRLGSWEFSSFFSLEWWDLLWELRPLSFFFLMTQLFRLVHYWQIYPECFPIMGNTTSINIFRGKTDYIHQCGIDGQVDASSIFSAAEERMNKWLVEIKNRNLQRYGIDLHLQFVKN